MADIETRVKSIEELLDYNSSQSTNLFDPTTAKEVKGGVKYVLSDKGFTLTSTKSTKYDGITTKSTVLPSTKYTVQFTVENFDDSNKSNARFGYTNAKGAMVGIELTANGEFSYSFTTGSEQTSTTLYFYIAYKNGIGKDVSLTFDKIMLTEGDKKDRYIPLLTLKDEVARKEVDRVNGRLTEVDKDIENTLNSLNSLKSTLQAYLIQRNEIPDVETDNYTIKSGIVHILTGGADKKRFSVLSNHIVKNDGFLTALNMGSYCYSSRIFVNGNQIAAITDLYEYPVYKGDKISIDITPRGPHYLYISIGEKASNEFNFLAIEPGTCYISTSGDNTNTGTTPFNPRKTPPFGDRSFKTFKFKGGDIFKGGLDGAGGHITSYGNGNAIFDSLEKVAVTYNEDRECYVAEGLKHLPGFLKYNEYEVCWNQYGEEWPTKYASYYKDKDIFGKNNSFYCATQSDGTYTLYLKSDRKLEYIYVPTNGTGIRVRSAAVIDHLTVRNFSGFGINVYGVPEDAKIEIRDIYCEYIGGGYFSPNCRYGNAIQVNADVSNCIIEDCITHDCFDTGATIQTNKGGHNNIIRRCKSWNCFWCS